MPRTDPTDGPPLPPATKLVTRGPRPAADSRVCSTFSMGRHNHATRTHRRPKSKKGKSAVRPRHCRHRGAQTRNGCQEWGGDGSTPRGGKPTRTQGTHARDAQLNAHRRTDRQTDRRTRGQRTGQPQHGTIRADRHTLGNSRDGHGAHTPKRKQAPAAPFPEGLPPAS